MINDLIAVTHTAIGIGIALLILCVFVGAGMAIAAYMFDAVRSVLGRKKGGE